MGDLVTAAVQPVAPAPLRYVPDEGMGRDTRTRYQGVFARHRKGCAVERGRKCSCTPSFYGKVYDRAEGRHISTRRFASATTARDARGDLTKAIALGDTPGRSDLRVRQVVERFVDAARAGIALNKHGRRYKASAVEDLAGSLNVHVVKRIGAKRATDVRPRDVQAIVDAMVEAGASGSRIRSVVNAIRSLYRFAQDRELVAIDPARNVRLPAMNAKPRERVATPAEFRRLLDALEPEDALPYALAAYGTARRAEILNLRWGDVDLELDALTLAADEDLARKYEASLRVVPIVRPLKLILRRAYLAQGRPARGTLVCPPRRPRRSTSRLAPGPLQVRAEERWTAAKLEPIGLHECRHTASTWLSAAGVNPKVHSVLMGHAVPERQAGAAAITFERYTHTLPGDLERARELLDGFLEERTQAEAAQK